MADVVQYVAGALVLTGSLFALLAAIGILRLPDLYTRMHAASKAGAVSAGFILAAVALLSADMPIILRALVGFIFLLLTTPVSAHLLAQASWRSGYKPAASTVINDLDAEIQSHS
jgi:multicomponent Na+:H+ antiporter subunit G